MKKTLPNSELDNVVTYMTLGIGYDFDIVLPYKEGVALLATLERAEKIERYYERDGLKFQDKSRDIVINSVTQKDYREAKIDRKSTRLNSSH